MPSDAMHAGGGMGRGASGRSSSRVEEWREAGKEGECRGEGVSVGLVAH